MPATYEPIATTTLGSAAGSITFSSIPQTYTDLRLSLVCRSDSGTGTIVRVQFNGDTTSTYTGTRLQGTGTAAESNRQTTNWLNFFYISGATDVWTHVTGDLMSYTGSTNKSSLWTVSDDENGSGWVQRVVCLYINTSAITSIYLYPNAANFSAGTTATLYGIKAA